MRDLFLADMLELYCIRAETHEPIHQASKFQKFKKSVAETGKKPKWPKTGVSATVEKRVVMS